MTNSYFKNATGLPDPEQHMSCRDIAILACRLIRDFPEHYHYESEETFRYNKIEQVNRNPLVQKAIADGLKTGHMESLATAFARAPSAVDVEWYWSSTGSTQCTGAPVKANGS